MSGKTVPKSRTPTPEDFEDVEETDGIFAFGKETYVWSWFSVPFKGGDFLGCVFRYEPKASITFVYRFRYHASPVHFDPNDRTRSYDASFDGPPEEALEGARKAALGIAREHGTEVEELAVNGNTGKAMRALMEFKYTKVKEMP